MITISCWALAAICLGLGAEAQNTDILKDSLRSLMCNDLRQEFLREE